MRVNKILIDSIVEFEFEGKKDMGLARFTVQQGDEVWVAIRICDGSLVCVPEKNCSMLYFRSTREFYSVDGVNIE